MIGKHVAATCLTPNQKEPFSDNPQINRILRCHRKVQRKKDQPIDVSVFPRLTVLGD